MSREREYAQNRDHAEDNDVDGAGESDSGYTLVDWFLCRTALE